MNAIARAQSGASALPLEISRVLDWYSAWPHRKVSSDSTLIPRNQRPAVIEACRAGLLPVKSAKDASGAVLTLLAPYRAVDFQDPNLASRLFAQRAAEYPADVLQAAIREIHSTLKFPP